MAPPETLRILFLHGYTRSGPQFSLKTKALQRALQKTFPTTSPSSEAPKSPSPSTSIPGGLECVYLTAPWRIRDISDEQNAPLLRQTPEEKAADLPGPGDDVAPNIPQFSDLIWTGGDANTSPDQNPDASYAWWSKDPHTGEYVGLEKTLTYVAEFMIRNGPFEGAIGFSQGGGLAGILASLLPMRNREARRKAVAEYKALHPLALDPSAIDLFADEVAIPPLRFTAAYGGFRADDVLRNPVTKELQREGWYDALYDPPITTPVLHFLGTLDVVVDEKRSMGLVENCAVGESGARVGEQGGGDTRCAGYEADLKEAERRVVRFVGGHFVPQGKRDVERLVKFVREQIAGPGGEVGRLTEKF